MKKFVFALLIGAFTLSLVSTPTVKADAQSTKLVSKTITAADTITFTAVPSKIKSFQYVYTETSGTTAGKVYLEGSIISGAWDLLDSLTLSDVTTAQKKTFAITATNYLNYRLRNTNTSSATGAAKAAWLRRSDE
jgi:hypothetical protein